MSVVSVKELPEGGGAIDRLYRRTYTRVFRVICSSTRDGPATIRASALVPKIGNSYYVNATEKDLGSFAETVDCAREKMLVNGQSSWKVTVNYGPYDASTFPADPLQWPLRVSWGYTQFEEVVWEDINAAPVVNSAGQRFQEAVTIDDSRPFLKIIRNETNFSAYKSYNYKDAINTNTFLGADPYAVKINGISAEILYSPEIQAYYAEVTYVFQFDKKKWKKIILDQGYCQLDGSSRLTAILDGKGQPVTEAALLDGAGHLAAHGATPTYLEFDLYDEIDFGVFNFDFSNVPGLA